MNLVRAITDGLNLNKSSVCTDDVDLQTLSLNYLFSNYPIFTPLVSFSDSEINSNEHKISHNFKVVDYCKYKPQDQKFDKDKVRELHTNLNIEAFLEDLPFFIKEISLNEYY